MQMENMHVKLLRELHLGPAQWSGLAACWDEWLAQKRGLNRSAEFALDALDSLPDRLPITLDHMSHIARLAAADHPRSSHQKASPATPTRPLVVDPHCKMHAGHACCAERAQARPQGSEVCGFAPRAGGGDGVNLDGRDVDGLGAGALLLGSDPRCVLHAADALRRLWRVQDAETRLQAAVLAHHRQPGGVLEARQLAQECRVNLELGHSAVDWLAMCQIAATRARRRELRRWPAVLGKPLPERI